jgi:hypothetical protein
MFGLRDRLIGNMLYVTRQQDSDSEVP